MGYRVAEPFELLVRLRERLLGAAPLGEIAGHLGIPDEAALRVPHRTDHGIGPEARAILAHAPPFVLVTALPLRDQSDAGLAGRPHRVCQGDPRSHPAAPRRPGARAHEPGARTIQLLGIP